MAGGFVISFDRWNVALSDGQLLISQSIRKKVPTVSIDEAISILKILPPDRQEVDLKILATFFRENNGLVSFWRKFGYKDDLNISMKLASNVHYFFFPFKGRAIFIR